MNPTENIRLDRMRLFGVAFVILVAAALFWLHRDEMSHENLLHHARSLPVFWFILLFLILPMVGLPISPFLVIAGLRFGFNPALAIVAVCIAFHNCAAYRLVHGYFRETLLHRMERAGYHIPVPKECDQIKFAAAFVGIQGPPYAVKLYLLALTGIPFRVYFWTGTPLYVLFAAIPVAAGSSVMAVNPLWIYASIFCMTGLVIAGRWFNRHSGSGMGV